MTKLSDLKPKKKEKVCVLLERAGIKVERNWDYAQSGSESLQGIERNGLGD